MPRLAAPGAHRRGPTFAARPCEALPPRENRAGASTRQRVNASTVRFEAPGCAVRVNASTRQNPISTVPEHQTTAWPLETTMSNHSLATGMPQIAKARQRVNASARQRVQSGCPIPPDAAAVRSNTPAHTHACVRTTKRRTSAVPASPQQASPVAAPAEISGGGSSGCREWNPALLSRTASRTDTIRARLVLMRVHAGARKWHC